MHEYQAPYCAGRDLNIRNLEGHANNKREISEVQVIRCFVIGKQKPSTVFFLNGIFFRFAGVKKVRITESKDSVN